jgi:hypothetical protein
MKQIKLIITVDGQVLVSEIEEVLADIGQPDCKLVKPFVLGFERKLTPFMGAYTDQDTFMISSDKILTLADPNEKLLEQYRELIE